MSTEELKYNSVFVFADGKLTIKRSGHGKANGWATLSIPESQIYWEDGCAEVEIPPSELRELRDFIDKELALSQSAVLTQYRG
jgi:hypothetical protein